MKLASSGAYDIGYQTERFPRMPRPLQLMASRSLGNIFNGQCLASLFEVAEGRSSLRELLRDVAKTARRLAKNGAHFSVEASSTATIRY